MSDEWGAKNPYKKLTNRWILFELNFALWMIAMMFLVIIITIIVSIRKMYEKF